MRLGVSATHYLPSSDSAVRDLRHAHLTLPSSETNRPAEVEVTDTEFNDFKFWVQYAAAAYCNYDKEPGEPVTCAGDECDDVQANNATIVTSVMSVPPYSQPAGMFVMDIHGTRG